MKKIFLIIAISFVSTLQLMAQDDEYTSEASIQYSVALPSSDLHNYVGKTSWLGIHLDYRKAFTKNFFGSFEGGWNVFYERMENASFTEGTFTVTGTQYRYVSAVPLSLGVGHYFKPGEKVNPYTQIGIGTIYNRTRLDVGIYEFEADAWHFLLKPEIGVMVQTSSDLYIMLASKYYFGFKTSDSRAVSYFTFNLGFCGLW